MLQFFHDQICRYPPFCRVDLGQAWRWRGGFSRARDLRQGAWWCSTFEHFLSNFKWKMTTFPEGSPLQCYHKPANMRGPPALRRWGFIVVWLGFGSLSFFLGAVPMTMLALFLTWCMKMVREWVIQLRIVDGIFNLLCLTNFYISGRFYTRQKCINTTEEAEWFNNNFLWLQNEGQCRHEWSSFMNLCKMFGNHDRFSSPLYLCRDWPLDGTFICVCTFSRFAGEGGHCFLNET